MNYAPKKEQVKKYLSLEETEKTLPAVDTLLRDLQALQNTLNLLESVEIEVEEEHAQHLSQLTKFNKTFHKLSYEFYEKLEQLGCMVKDVEQGLVDFVHYFEGREVLLCWKLGEENIHYWHELDSGFMGRKKIVDLERRQFTMKG